MNKNHLILSAIVAAVVIALGWMVLTAIPNSRNGSLGATNATTTYNSALQQNSLYLWETGVAGDLSSLRSPLSGMLTTSTAAIGFPAVASSSPQTTTTAPGIAAALGDIVIVSETTSSPGFYYAGHVETASTTSATFGIGVWNGTTGATAVAPSSTKFNITVLPRATFLVPATLNISTTSAPYNP